MLPSFFFKFDDSIYAFIDGGTHFPKAIEFKKCTSARTMTLSRRRKKRRRKKAERTMTILTSRRRLTFCAQLRRATWTGCRLSVPSPSCSKCRTR